jgi:hypothetical protein
MTNLFLNQVTYAKHPSKFQMGLWAAYFKILATGVYKIQLGILLHPNLLLIIDWNMSLVYSLKKNYLKKRLFSHVLKFIIKK